MPAGMYLEVGPEHRLPHGHALASTTHHCVGGGRIAAVRPFDRDRATHGSAPGATCCARATATPRGVRTQSECATEPSMDPGCGRLACGCARVGRWAMCRSHALAAATAGLQLLPRMAASMRCPATLVKGRRSRRGRGYGVDPGVVTTAPLSWGKRPGLSADRAPGVVGPGDGSARPPSWRLYPCYRGSATWAGGERPSSAP